MCVASSFVAGRLFDFHVLDMIELGIEKYVSLSDIKVMVAVFQLPSVSSVGRVFLRVLGDSQSQSFEF